MIGRHDEHHRIDQERCEFEIVMDEVGGNDGDLGAALQQALYRSAPAYHIDLHSHVRIALSGNRLPASARCTCLP